MIPSRTAARLQYACRRCTSWAIDRLRRYELGPQARSTGDHATSDATAKATRVDKPAHRTSGGSHAIAYGLKATATARRTPPTIGRFAATTSDARIRSPALVSFE